tara:strand:+ start:2182 stop:2979 length:798 start_codon:yes stop_codon:yes gene_type:complete
MSLTNKTIASTYKDILQVDNSNNGISTSTLTIKSGNGTETCASISDDQLTVQPKNDNSTGTFVIKESGGTTLLAVDSQNTAVKALNQYVNTQTKQFVLASINSEPHTANTWTMMSAIGNTRFNSTSIEMGTGSTPATTYDISATDEADNLVQAMWYVPFNIAIDSCNVWLGADTATGDDVKFSVMSYTVSTANDATGGDLSAGVENCVSPSVIAGAGHEIAYYQALTVSNANVDAGKIITANVHQNGTNSDLTVNMQLVYHLRST